MLNVVPNAVTHTSEEDYSSPQRTRSFDEEGLSEVDLKVQNPNGMWNKFVVLLPPLIGQKRVIEHVCRLAASEILGRHAACPSYIMPRPHQSFRLLSSTEPNSRQGVRQQQELCRPLLDRMKELRDITEKDCSSDVQWPTAQAFEEAEEFIRLLPISDIPVPKIYMAHDGDINFLWKRKDDGLHIDLGLYGDGTYSYYATNNGEQEFMDDAVKVSKGLPDSLVKILTT